MGGGEWLSVAINLAVGLYLVWFYPRALRARLGSGRLPPLFALLRKVVPLLGYLLLAGTVLYVGMRLSGYAI